jgi:hypothetical protein
MDIIALLLLKDDVSETGIKSTSSDSSLRIVARKLGRWIMPKKFVLINYRRHRPSVLCLFFCFIPL